MIRVPMVQSTLTSEAHLALHTQHGVYAIQNTRTRRMYVGCTSQTFGARRAVHRRNLSRGAHQNRELQADWNQYGPDAFEFVILAAVETYDMRLIRGFEHRATVQVPEELRYSDLSHTSNLG